jgi:hypothetical protein
VFFILNEQRFLIQIPEFIFSLLENQNFVVIHLGGKSRYMADFWLYLFVLTALWYTRVLDFFGGHILRLFQHF